MSDTDAKGSRINSTLAPERYSATELLVRFSSTPRLSPLHFAVEWAFPRTATMCLLGPGEVKTFVIRGADEGRASGQFIQKAIGSSEKSIALRSLNNQHRARSQPKRRSACSLAWSRSRR